jgi:hypothetical protein
MDQNSRRKAVNKPSSPAAQAHAAIMALPTDRWPTTDELEPLRSVLIQRARDERRMPRRSGWGFGPTELTWMVGVIASGIIGNAAYDAVKSMVARITAKWVADDSDAWLRKLASKAEWEELRILRHPKRPAELYVEERFAERAEARLVELQAEAARDYPAEPPPRLRGPSRRSQVVAPEKALPVAAKKRQRGKRH